MREGDALKSRHGIGSGSADEPETLRLDGAELIEDDLIGVQVGNYHILSRLGKGSYGVVYRARDIQLQRDVALKMLHSPMDEAQRGQFLQEARALSELGGHPGIVQIFHWGEYEGRTFFVMEYAPATLQALLNEHPSGIPARVALRVVLDCARALAHAHRHGLIHRDIKPSNILIDRETHRARLADFGLVAGKADPGGTGISGSPGFIAPEILRGQPADERSDIYALGVTLLRSLMGKSCAQSGSSAGPPSAAGVPSDAPVPEVLRTVIEKMTAADPAARYANAAELAKALEGTRETVAGAAPETETKRSGWARIAAMALVALGLTVAGYFSLARNTPPAELAHAALLLKQGNYERAATLYERAVAQGERSTEVLAGLGFALLGSGRVQDARHVFEQIEDDQRRLEGRCALLHKTQGENARKTLEQVQRDSGSAYASVLLAGLDLTKGDGQRAYNRLAKIGAPGFLFGWQEELYHWYLGRALHALGRHAEALTHLEALSDTHARLGNDYVQAYAEMVRWEIEHNRGEALSRKIERIKDAMEEHPLPNVSSAEQWSSRPLRFCLLPADTGSSAAARESGIAAVLPWRLGAALTKQTPMQQVDRALLNALLTEYELTSGLAGDEEKHRLGRLLGADLLIECRFDSFQQRDFLNTTVVDVATTLQFGVRELEFQAAEPLEALTGALSAAIWEAVAAQKPLQGIVTVTGEQTRLNLGKNVGVQAGMRFLVLSGGAERHPLPGQRAVVEEVSPAVSAVKLEGIPAGAVPASGLYVREEPKG